MSSASTPNRHSYMLALKYACTLYEALAELLAELNDAAEPRYKYADNTPLDASYDATIIALAVNLPDPLALILPVQSP